MIYVLLVSASFVWGINVLVMKDILTIVPMYFLAALRVGISFISLFIAMKIKKQDFVGVDYKIATKISVFALTINFALTFMGMEKISGTHNAIMNALAPLVTIIIAFSLLHSKLQKKQLLAMVVALFGFGLSLEWNYHNLDVGHGLLLLGMISYCYANITMQGSRNANNYLPFTTIYLLFGFFELLVISLIVEPNAYLTLSKIPLLTWFWFILFSGIGFAYIQVVYLYSLKVIGSIKTSFFLSLNPIFTYIGAIIFFNEELDILKTLAFGCMIMALLIANFNKEWMIKK